MASSKSFRCNRIIIIVVVIATCPWLLSMTSAYIDSGQASNLIETPQLNRDNNDTKLIVDIDTPTTRTRTAAPATTTPDSIVNYFDDLDYESLSPWGSEQDCPYRQGHLPLWTKNPDTFVAPNCSAVFDFKHQPKYNKKTRTKRRYPSFYRLNKWKPKSAHTDTSILEMVRNCTYLRSVVGFPDRPASDEERSFPLAYVFAGQRNADQTLRLFRAIYWPQNAYCFTYDNKSKPVYKEFMLSLARCFPENVVVNPKPMNVSWGHDSVLYNVMNCFDPLMEMPIQWKYLQIVSYNDFPLKTNLEMVKILKVLNGSNDCDLIKPLISFYSEIHDYKNYYNRTADKRKPVPPDGLMIFKGSYATTMTREFVHYVLNDTISKKLYKWFDGTFCAEEHYWTSLIHNSHLKAPGSFPGQCLWFYDRQNTKKPYISRCQVWDEGFGASLDGYKCKGKRWKWSCVYGVDDVPWLLERPEMMAHKLYGEYQPAALYCMEQWHWAKVCSHSTQYFDSKLKYYQHLPAVRYQNAVDKEAFRC